MISAILYGVSMLVLLAFGLNLLVLVVALVRDQRLIDGPVPKPGILPDLPDNPPVITVQLPIYNEALVAQRLIDACIELDYPKNRLEIQVLDDSDDETFDIVSERVEYWKKQGFDILHVHRDDRQGFKAGALQNGLRIARGDYIAIFDADFIPPPFYLKRVLAGFSAPDIGVVQARWTHLNESHSILTRLQALALDAHFMIEQRVRNLTGCYINFNGTAGMWRRDCIEDAGGWNADTLTEDLDLSYRAQMKGWKFVFDETIEVPAELPVEISGFRAQQFRWTKGAVQTARKLLPSFWRSELPIAKKLEGTVHLTGYFVFPFVLLVALLHAPLVWFEQTGTGPGQWFFAACGIGLIGFAGFVASQIFSQRDLHHDWLQRMMIMPVFVAGSMGMAVNNTRAILEGLAGRKSPFVRTPKYNSTGASGGHWWKSAYAGRSLSVEVFLEALMMIYSIVGLVVIIMLGQWAAVPFQLLFALGFGLMATYGVKHRVMAARD
ncbi:MAG: glycosyltransferase [Rhodothermales bacterium]|nr:glycosyltransferase [Rhodothermales bacterium]